jgi:hypothetical protein
MGISRREALQVAGTGVALGLAGCAGLSGSGSRAKMDVVVENYRDEAVQLAITVLDPDASDRSDGVAYHTDVEIPANATGDDEWRAEDVAERRQYRVEVRVGRTGKSHHYHYVPDCVGEESEYEPAVGLVLNDEPGVSFGQSGCDGGVSWPA